MVEFGTPRKRVKDSLNTLAGLQRDRRQCGVVGNFGDDLGVESLDDSATVFDADHDVAR